MSGHSHIACDGALGRDGHHGSSGHYGRGHGGNGGDGFDAGDGQRGNDARDIDLTLSTSAGGMVGSEQILSFTGTQSGSAGARDFGQLSLSAIGGSGGTGGNGGDGGHGSSGYSGCNATQYSSGTNGGPGGRGGDAGVGGNGGDAGAGGRIAIHVQPTDSYLLMAVNQLDEPRSMVGGGAGGHHGHHGSAGHGGSGGRGGSSYSWSTTEGYGDDQKSVDHTNPGGHSGPRGADGRSNTRPLHRGRDGHDGTVDLLVGGQRFGRQQRFGRRYQLSVNSFTVVALGSAATPAAASDGVYEFGELCAAQEVRLANRAGADRMTSPAEQRVRVRLQRNQWVAPTGEDAFCAQPIAPAGVSAALESGVGFQINYDPRNGFRPSGREADFAAEDLGSNVVSDFDPIVAPVSACAVASQLGVEDAAASGSATAFQRDYADGNLTRSVTAQFPVRNTSHLVGLTSLANGEGSNLALAMENISTHNLGRDALRPVKVMLWADRPAEGSGGAGDAHHIWPHQMWFASALDGAEHSLDYPGYTFDAPLLPTDQFTSLQGRFVIRDVPAYAGGELRAGLFISDLHDPSGWRLAQRRALKVRCEPAFAPHLRGEGAISLLLVCSTATSQAKYSAWLAAASSLGLRAEVYPLTRYGHLDPLEVLPFGQPLGAYLADGCLAVCLDDEFESIKRTLLPTDVVAPWHLRAVGSEGAPCNYLVVRRESPGDRMSRSSVAGLLNWKTTQQAGLLRRLAAAPPPDGVGNTV